MTMTLGVDDQNDGNPLDDGMATATTKQIAAEALNELKRLQKVERAQRHCLEATEPEMASINAAISSILTQSQRQRANNKKKRKNTKRKRTASPRRESRSHSHSQPQSQSAEDPMASIRDSLRKRLSALRSERKHAEMQCDALNAVRCLFLFYFFC